MSKTFFVSVITIILLLASPLMAEEPVQVKGTRVTMTPPPGFVRADIFNGFQLKEKTATIMVVELPAPYAAATAGFTKEGLEARGMTLLEKSEVTVGGMPGLLLKIAQKAHGTDFEKWTLATGSKDFTIVINGSYPVEYSKELSLPVKNSLLSAQLSGKAPAVKDDDIPFSITAEAPLKFARSLMKSIILTKNGEFPAKSPEDPVFIASPSLSSGLVITDRKEFSLKRVMKIEQVKEVKVISSREVTIDSLQGNEILASGKDSKEGFPVFIYQVMLYGESDYFIIQGLVGAREKEKYLPLFRKCASSLRRK
jgi:hypothetical protein